jgi:hypothetical protein
MPLPSLSHAGETMTFNGAGIPGARIFIPSISGHKLQEQLKICVF